MGRFLPENAFRITALSEEQMKSALYHYSQTGNTKLICAMLKREIPELTVIDIFKKGITGIEKYDLTGFASFTYNLTLSPFMPIYAEFFGIHTEQGKEKGFFNLYLRCNARPGCLRYS